MKTTFWTGLFLLLSMSVLLAQSELERQYLLDLQEGILLIRLNTSNNKIKKLKEKGLDRQVMVMTTELKSYNRIVRETFSEKYNFSNFYFFYNTDTGKILAKNYENVLFDSKGETVALDKIEQPIYILTIGTYLPPKSFSYNNNWVGFVINKIEEGKITTISSKEPFFLRVDARIPNERVVRRFKRSVHKFNKLCLAMAQRQKKKLKRRGVKI